MSSCPHWSTANGEDFFAFVHDARHGYVVALDNMVLEPAPIWRFDVHEVNLDPAVVVDCPFFVNLPVQSLWVICHRTRIPDPGELLKYL